MLPIVHDKDIFFAIRQDGRHTNNEAYLVTGWLNDFHNWFATSAAIKPAIALIIFLTTHKSRIAS